MRWLIPLAFIMPIALMFPVLAVCLLVFVYLLIPIYFLCIHVKQNLHWGKPKRSGKYGKLRREHRAKERFIRGMKLPPDEERVVRQRFADITIRKMERR